MRWCTIILALNVLAGAGMAATTTKKPTTMVARDRCVTPDCHPGVKKYNVVHAPLTMDSCDACHDVVSASAHTFKLARSKEHIPPIGRAESNTNWLGRWLRNRRMHPPGQIIRRW